MKKLELRHLSPYLPYGLNVMVGNKQLIVEGLSKKTVATDSFFYNEVEYAHLKPILRPLNSFYDFEEILDEMSEFNVLTIEDNPDMLLTLPYCVLEKMFENHIDVFGLIGKVLAISINDLKN